MEELNKAVLLIKEMRSVLMANMKDIERMNEFADRYGLHRFNLMEAETLDILERTKEYEDRAIIQQQLQPDNGKV